MEQLLSQLRGALSGTISTSPALRSSVRRDASLFEITPDAVITPESSKDIQSLVRFVMKHKAAYPKLAITPRGAGTDMTGAAIGSSIVLDLTKLDTIHSFKGRLVHAHPGAKVYDIERMLGAHSLALGSSPTSRDVATLGGIVANNSAGERSFMYGSTQRWVSSLKVVLADGKEYTVRPMSRRELERKMAEPTYEGRLYAHLYSILNRHYDIIRNARPHTVRNASGYNLWDIWDREEGIFDLTQLFIGSQGTLGIVTDITIEAVKKPQYVGALLVRMPTLKKLDAVLKTIKEHSPLSIEGFDDITFLQGLRTYKLLRKQIGNREYAKQQIQLLPSATVLKGSAPQLILTAEIEGDTHAELLEKLERLHEALQKYKIQSDVVVDNPVNVPLRRMRQSTLALLQDKMKTQHASPFIDDMAVHPDHIAAFLPRLRRVLKKHKLPATIHGHFGDGIFHVLPLSQITSVKEQVKLEPIMRDIIKLTLEYDGSLSGEHGDGMIRGPWLPAQFNQEVYTLFRQVKELFDPLYIFNPHKKTDATWEYSMSHLREFRPHGKKR